ncbi:NAD(P)-dependent oxidoreductase [Orrella daihaiensis]|uniref:3-phosphoglycerate dehydrogenase n=1 Tax=Orrella daihaiensis TaxID=2782176 RepID=A0ABY4AHG3_9BURK|nr:NAD(P)-dependent oxidoreductase [Orrella daihaiensis]UOD49726.1 3-phosphoglycerate dehydrogenase [Orrella daihaiensis]
MRAVFIDASDMHAAVTDRLRLPTDIDIMVNRNIDITPDEIPAVVGDADIAWIDHTGLPTDIASQCPNLRHVVFMGTGARSYMNPEELAEIGIQVHIIKGYGDTAVAECAFGLMWAAAKDFAYMDRGVRAGGWPRRDGLQLTGKTVGLIGFGGIGAEMARLCLGAGMRVIAWNRSPKNHSGVQFMSLDEVLMGSDVISVHLLLNDETRGLIDRECIQKMRDGVLLINTARGAVVDEPAMIQALVSGKIGHAALDVYTTEPMPAGHPLSQLENVTLSAHSAFRTQEASDNLIEAALAHCRRIVAEG